MQEMNKTFKRAVWLDVRADVKSEKDAKAAVEWCRESNIDIVFAGVNHASGLMTYASDVAPRLAETDRWDPTQVFLDRFRAAGIETHAWVCISMWGGGKIDPKCVSSRGPRTLQEAHKDWFCVDQNGQSVLANGTKYAFVDPANRSVREFHVRLCEEVLDRYPFDGYHLDYIRYNFQTPQIPAKHKEAYTGKDDGLIVQLEGSERLSFDDATLKAFQRDTGLDLMGAGPDLASRVRWLYSSENGGARREAWYAWKSAQVTEVVRLLGSAVHKRGRKLSAAVFGGYPWCGQEIAQRWPGWVDQRLLDFAAPMDYGVTIDEYPVFLRNQIAAMKVEPRPAVPLISGIYSAELFDGLSEAGSDKLLARYMEIAKAEGRRGICLYCYKLFRKIFPSGIGCFRGKK
ncbi:MAG: hypothetical protein C0404_13590 [Verrucomicrobia bacterium]|nr:hypothetical protein [Verrucomicrobiota bacterium]